MKGLFLVALAVCAQRYADDHDNIATRQSASEGCAMLSHLAHKQLLSVLYSSGEWHGQRKSWQQGQETSWRAEAVALMACLACRCAGTPHQQRCRHNCRSNPFDRPNLCAEEELE